MTKNIIVAIKTLQDVKDFIESEDIKAILKQMTEVRSFLEKFKDLEHLTTKLREIEGLVYIGKEFLTIKEAAKYMGISMSTVYKLTSAGELDTYRLTGKMVYVLREDVNSLIRQNRRASESDIIAQAEREARKYIENQKKNNKRDKKGGKNG